MTALEHNKFVGYAHLGYAAIHVLMLVVTFGFMGVMLTTSTPPPPPESWPGINPTQERFVSYAK